MSSNKKSMCFHVGSFRKNPIIPTKFVSFYCPRIMIMFWNLCPICKSFMKKNFTLWAKPIFLFQCFFFVFVSSYSFFVIIYIKYSKSFIRDTEEIFDNFIYVFIINCFEYSFDCVILLVGESVFELKVSSKRSLKIHIAISTWISENLWNRYDSL